MTTSIVVVNWNTRETTLRCLASVRARTRAPFELIVIDNGSDPSVMTRVGYAVPCGIFLWIAWNTIRRALMMHQMFASGPLARERWPLFCSNAAMGVALAVIYGGLWSWFGVWGALKYHAVPAAVAMVTSWVIVTIQHANENSRLYPTRNYAVTVARACSTTSSSASSPSPSGRSSPAPREGAQTPPRPRVLTGH